MTELFSKTFFTPFFFCQQQLLGEEYDSDDEPPAPPTEEKNPLYSTDKEYVADFSNPIYRPAVHKKMTGEGIALVGTDQVVVDENIPLSEHEISQMDDTQEVDMGEADTLF